MNIFLVLVVQLSLIGTSLEFASAQSKAFELTEPTGNIQKPTNYSLGDVVTWMLVGGEPSMNALKIIVKQSNIPEPCNREYLQLPDRRKHCGDQLDSVIDQCLVYMVNSETNSGMCEGGCVVVGNATSPPIIKYSSAATLATQFLLQYEFSSCHASNQDNLMTTSTTSQPPIATSLSTTTTSRQTPTTLQPPKFGTFGGKEPTEAMSHKVTTAAGGRLLGAANGTTRGTTTAKQSIRKTKYIIAFSTAGGVFVLIVICFAFIFWKSRRKRTQEDKPTAKETRTARNTTRSDADSAQAPEGKNQNFYSPAPSRNNERCNSTVTHTKEDEGLYVDANIASPSAFTNATFTMKNEGVYDDVEVDTRPKKVEYETLDKRTSEIYDDVMLENKESLQNNKRSKPNTSTSKRPDSQTSGIYDDVILNKGSNYDNTKRKLQREDTYVLDMKPQLNKGEPAYDLWG